MRSRLHSLPTINSGYSRLQVGQSIKMATSKESRTGDGRPRHAARTRRDETLATSYASSASARSRMQVQRVRDTAPELALRRRLHAAGLRYWVDRAPLVGLRRRADIVFPRAKVAVFVDGCFWHSCPEHGTQSKSNATWWKDKLLRNQVRDRDTDRRLIMAGWSVLRIWEHEDPQDAAEKVIKEVKDRRRSTKRFGNSA